MTGIGTSLSGLRLLIVEDEAMVAMLVEDYLADLDCALTEIASSLAQGLERARSGASSFDGAILDVNIAGEEVFPLADILAAQGKPFVFTSGYGAAGVVSRFADRPVVEKPFTFAALEAGIRAAFDIRGGHIEQ